MESNKMDEIVLTEEGGFKEGEHEQEHKKLRAPFP